MARKNADPSPESPPPPPPPAPEPPDIPVVGIGASAGGLDALKQFFRAMPPDCGIAFVVILHLDPTHQSLLAEIIGRETRMPVRQVERPTPVEPDHVYVIPPGTYLALREGVLCLSEPAAARGQRVPIDFFFRSLAGDRREKAVGIILSGTGTEGALGVKDIHAAGGMVLVQAPETAEHPGMPRAAVATGAADHVLPVGQMPARILDHLRHSYVNGGRREGEGPEACPDHLAALLDLVRDRPVTGARDAEGLYRVGFEDKPGETPAAARPEGEANLARQLESELQATRADLQNLLACTDIAAVFLDTEFRIKCFTPVTTRLLNLIPSDVGRPISDLAQKFTCAELLPDARAVLERLAPVEKEVCADDRWFIRRILPYRTHDNRIEGVVITFTDVTSLHRAAEETRGRARQQAALAELSLRALAGPPVADLMGEAVRVVAETLGAEFAEVLRVRPGGRGLDRVAGVGWGPGAGEAGAGTQAGYTLQLRAPVVVEDYAREKRFAAAPHLRDCGAASGVSAAILGEGTPFGVLAAYATRPGAFAPGDADFLQATANVLAQTLNRQRREEDLRALTATLERRVAARTALVKLVRDVAAAANEAANVGAAMRFALRRAGEHDGWALGHVWEVSPDGGLVPTALWHARPPRAFPRFRRATARLCLAPGQGLPGRVLAEGKPVWAADVRRDPAFLRRAAATEEGLLGAVAFPVTAGRDRTHVLEFFARDPVEPDPALLEAFAAIGVQLGRVVERHRLQADLADAVQQEQQRLGRELHDTLGQQLSGLGMAAKVLADRLAAARSPEAEPAARIVQGLQEATAQARNVARGLFPVEPDEQGLPAALIRLAETTRQRHRIDCDAEVRGGAGLSAAAGRQLFYIAREAVANAVKHARCRRIGVRLDEQGGRAVLEVRDDGAGLPEDPGAAGGMGLRIMRYRASLIGATLDVQNAEGGGTLVRCTLAKEARDDEEGDGGEAEAGADPAGG